MRLPIGHARGIAVQTLGIEPERIGLLAKPLVGSAQFLAQRRKWRVVRVGGLGCSLMDAAVHGQDGGVGQRRAGGRSKAHGLGRLDRRRIAEERIGRVRQSILALHVAHGLGAVR